MSGGQTILVSSDATFSVGDQYGAPNKVSVGTTGAGWWSVWMFGRSNQTRLTTGTYSDVLRAPFNNPALGGFDVSGDGRGCNNEFSTFTVDHITYDSAGNVTSIEARFVQRCESPTAPPLYGSLRVG